MIHYDINTLIPYVTSYKDSGKTIVWTNGCFDLLHPGHIEGFAHAKSLGDIVIVGVNGDMSPYRSTKKGSSVFDEDFRSKMIDSIKYVDHVIIFQEENPYNIIKAIIPQIIVKGNDYKDISTIAGYDVVINNGGKIVIDDSKKYSSTKIFEMICKKLTT